MAEPKVKSISTGKIVSLVLIVALAAAVTVLIIQNLGLRSEVAEGVQTEEELTSEIQNVEQQLKEFEFTMQSQSLDIEEKEKMLQAKETLMAEQEAKIASLVARNRLSQEEAERLRGRVEQLEWYVNKYQGDIAALKEEIALRDAQIAQLTDSLGNLGDERDSIHNDNVYKGIQLEGARKLLAHSFEFFRKKQSGSEVPETSFRASQMDHLKICMTVGENNTTKKGIKDVYVRILGPKGELVKNDAVSGFFKYSGNDTQYTTKAKMDYQGENVRVCMEFEQPNGFEYAEGNYKVLSYCEDRIIGKSEFEVK